MSKNYFNKNSTVSAILILSLAFSPFGLIPKKVEAQSVSAYGGMGLGAAMSVLPNCVNLSGGISGLFSGIGNLFKSNPSSSEIINEQQFMIENEAVGGLSMMQKTLLTDPGGATLDAKLNAAIIEFDSISVYDERNAAKLHEIANDITFLKKDIETLKNNDSCLDAIGKMLVKMTLQKITLSTIDWINSGFEGEPTWIKQPGVFFNDIAKNEILQFGIEINNSELFPFGKEWLRNQAAAFNNKFADNARYSLTELMQQTTPQFTAADFHADFSSGGWSAWTYLTQVPANNPLGFNLMAANELQKRLAGTESGSTAQNIRDGLMQAGGFLGDERCIDPQTGKPNGISRAQHAAGLRDGKILCPSGQWQYVTPGKMIAEAATSAIGYPKDWLLGADDLNDAVAAISDAIIAHFANKWMTEGLANMGSDGITGSFMSNNAYQYSPPQTQKDFAPIHLTSSWLKTNPNFNIRTGLTQALIDEQRTYIDKLEKQNKELVYTADGKKYAIGTNGVSNARGLIPVLYQLDYCIPGPHPGWENDSRRTLMAISDTIVPENPTSLEDVEMAQIGGMVSSLLPIAGGAIGASLVVGTGASAMVLGMTLGSAAPIVGTIIGAAIGAIVGWLISLFSSDDVYFKTRIYYSAILGALTGIRINPEDPPGEGEGTNKQAGNIQSKQSAFYTLNIMLDRYSSLISKVYNKEFLPDVARESEANFNKIRGYNSILDKNEQKISEVKNTINKLSEIKNAIDDLNRRLFINNINDEEYERLLKTHIDAFGRVSAYMVNGDDIASADNILKEIIDETNYSYKELLKGTYGCEKDLEQWHQKPIDKRLDEKIYHTKRPYYPFPILYDYNMFAKGTTLPDPLGLMGSTKIIMNSDYSKRFYDVTLGPGFLSAFIFQTNSNDLSRLCDKNPDINYSNLPSYACELQIGDLLPMHGGVKSLGQTSRLSNDPSSQLDCSKPIYSQICDAVRVSGPFETTIGVY
ncbi:MAG TPA: hypothetical protein VFQ59_01140 [Candidatus Paceibacterota bacterium]|nr:hypothetical protein [Candidatus Paceibacterota bacterium]